MLTNSQRIQRDQEPGHRKLVPINIRIYNTMREDLKDVAKIRGDISYQGLARYYIARGLQADLEAFEAMTPEALELYMRERNASEESIRYALDSK